MTSEPLESTKVGPRIPKRHAAKCTDCGLQLAVCICAWISCNAQKIKTRITVIAHSNELRKPTNTGRLATQFLTNSKLLVHGAIGTRILQEDLELDEAYACAVLFPDPSAIDLRDFIKSDFASGRPIHLIVPDGNWRQAQNMTRRVPGLLDLPRVFIPEPPKSGFIIRRPPKSRPESLATLEAIAFALRYTESSLEVSDELLELFYVKVNRTLWAKGKTQEVAEFTA